jgi:hypothetical protein
MGKKIKVLAVFAMVLAGPVLMAQTEVRVVVVPRVRIYLGPVENGTAEEQDYFTNSMTTEFTSAGYQMVDTKEDSDYNMTMEITRSEPDPDEEPFSNIAMVLFETKSEREVVSQGWAYQDFTEMNQWNLYAITQMMANTPIIKITPDAEMLGVPAGGEQPHRAALYLGLQAGGIFDLSFIQNSGGYEGGVGRGFGGEGALLAEFQPLRFLSLQTGVGMSYDTFMAGRIIEGEETRMTDTFRSLSLLLPLWIKIPVTVDGVVLSPFVGAYYLLPLDVMNIGKTGTYKTDLPLGLSLGFEWGIPLNTQMLFFGLRFDYDIGLSSAGEDDALRYSRTRIGLFVGYKFRVWRRGGTN